MLNFPKFLVVQNNSEEHHYPYCTPFIFLKLRPVLGVDINLEILLKSREIERVYGSKETN